MESAVELVHRLVSSELHVEGARSSGGLSLVSVFGPERPEPAYIVAASGFTQGTLTINEAGRGSVSQLIVQNRGERPVLLIDGEHLEGGRQNRVLTVSVLAAPMHETVIPVSCVEQGRWMYRGGHAFLPATEIGHPRLRSETARTHAESVLAGHGHLSDQSVVWAEVERARRGVGARPSPTSAMRDLFEDRRKELSEITQALAGPVRGQIGVVASVSDRPLAADIFEHPSILEQLWPRLVAGYAMNALGHPPAAVEPSVIESMLATVVAAPATTREDLGLGTEVIVASTDVIANALTWQQGVVHLAVFSVDGPRSPNLAGTDAPPTGPSDQERGD